jgi:two-component system sensor histidine kinase DevS
MASPAARQLEIIDDGCSVGLPRRSSGLTNMRRGAEHPHGTFTVACPDGGGTYLTWTAQISSN